MTAKEVLDTLWKLQELGWDPTLHTADSGGWWLTLKLQEPFYGRSITEAVAQALPVLQGPTPTLKGTLDARHPPLCGSGETPCEDCGRPALHGPDPYAEELYDDLTPHWLCQQCRADRHDAV
jgi:hypothetical protein